MPKIVPLLPFNDLRKRKKDFVLIYTALLFVSVHWALVIYINSSFLEQFVTAKTVSILYTIGAILSLLIFFHIPLLLRNIGNYKLTIFLAILEFSVVCAMGFVTSPVLASILFLTHFVTVPLLLFNLDVYIEALIDTQEQQTGSKRGLYLTFLSIATALGPLFAGSLITDTTTSFALVYIVSALFLLPYLAIIFLNFNTFKDPEYGVLSLRSMAHIFKESRDTRTIVIISTHLQLFFTWMVIYTPLYLANVVGFSWAEIGSIMFVGLSAYVIFEYPIGVIADKYIGEKEMMAFGFVVMAVSTSWFAFLTSAPIGIWMIAMFLTRVGASFVEATSESYFFKHAGSIDAHKISLFRMTRPLSAVIGAVLGSIAILYFPFNLLFILLALLMIPGLFFTLMLKDTK
jgi:predicted MFS family arabinose efflux permease